MQFEVGISSCFPIQLDAASPRFARQLPGNKSLRKRGPRSRMAILRRKCKVPRPPTVEASGVSDALSTGVSLGSHISSASSSSSSVSPVSHIHSSSLPQTFVNSSSQHICNSIPENGAYENTSSGSSTIRNSHSHDISSSTSVHQIHNSSVPQSHAVAGAQNIYSSNVSQVQAVAAASASTPFIS